MRQDVRKQHGKGFSSGESLLSRFVSWIDYGKVLLTAAGDGAVASCLHTVHAVAGAKQPRTSLSRPTRKEADKMSANAQRQLRVHIRWMIRRDMPEVLAIERDSFEFPWFEEDFVRCLRMRNCIGMVAEHGERVVGFMIYELHKTRLHILNFAVAAGARQRSVGQQMAQKLVSKLSSQRRTRITLEVRETNLAAQLFFKHVGFRATTVLRAYYDDSPEDAYVMQFSYAPDPIETIAPTNRIRRLAG